MDSGSQERPLSLATTWRIQGTGSPDTRWADKLHVIMWGDGTELHPLKNLYFSWRLPTDLWTWQNISSLQLYKRLATFTSTSPWGWRRLLRRMQVTKTEDFPPVVWQTKIRLNPIEGRFISHLSLWVGNVWIIFFLTYFSAIQNIHKQN